MPISNVNGRFADEHDVCPVCGGKLEICKGNELGHIFALGTRYTDKFNTTYIDSDGKSKIMQMGCYGIGLERTVASIIDQHHDEKGLELIEFFFNCGHNLVNQKSVTFIS